MLFTECLESLFGAFIDVILQICIQMGAFSVDILYFRLAKAFHWAVLHWMNLVVSRCKLRPNLFSGKWRWLKTELTER